MLPRLRTDRVSTEQRTAKTEYPLILVVTIQRQRYPVNLGRKLTLAEWDSKAKKAKGNRAAAINAIIVRKRVELTIDLEEAARNANGKLTMSAFRAMQNVQPFKSINP